MPYVRTVKTASGATAVQIVYSSHRGSRDIEHIGSAHDDGEVELLKVVARQRLAAGQGELDLDLGTAAGGGPLPITAARDLFVRRALAVSAGFRPGDVGIVDRIVQRLDKETSGLIVFARTVPAERGLGMQFRVHDVTRRYLAVVAGRLLPQSIRTSLVPDRGDGRRGSTTNPKLGKEAVTHVAVEETLPGYTILSCRLETGRTHQIRIHLAELGHPVCGEDVYNRTQPGEVIADRSGAPRLALHAAELGFAHPAGSEPLMPSTSPVKTLLMVTVALAIVVPSSEIATCRLPGSTAAALSPSV